MPSSLRIRLTPCEEQSLLELRKNPKIGQRPKERAEALSLSALVVESVGDCQSS